MKNPFSCELKALIYKLLMTIQSTRESKGDGVWCSGFFIVFLVFFPVRVEQSPYIFLQENGFLEIAD